MPLPCRVPSFPPSIRHVLELALYEIADVVYISPDRNPVRLSSSEPGIVEITADNRLIGRAVGKTNVLVNQSGETLGTVAVTVTKADFQDLFFDPGSQVVEVDGTLRPRVFAKVVGSEPPRNAEIAPQWIAAEKKPAAEFAQFDPRAFELTGVKPTNSSSPQELAVRMGTLTTAAPVQVVMAPCRLEVAPPGPIDLPAGQMLRLQAIANYSGGRRVPVRSERLKWLSQEKDVPGLELYDGNNPEAVGAVGALKAGAGPLNVYANYYGQESNRVTVKSVEADPSVKLDIDVDRTLRIAGEQGRAVLTASNSNGDVELVPSLTKFTSDNEKVMKMIPGKTGQFATGIPGDAVLTGSHVAAREPAKKPFHVGDPIKMKLAFDPASVRVPVNQKALLPLWLMEMEADGKKAKQKAELLGQGVNYYVEKPDAVRFYPPVLTGLDPAAPFDIAASIPILSQPAMAKVEVAGTQTAALRITPSAASPLAPGQQVSLMVEEQVILPSPAGTGGEGSSPASPHPNPLPEGEGTTAWKEVRPKAVQWTVPPQSQFSWTEATEDLRPTITLLPDLQGEVKLDAALGGASASVVFALKAAGPDAKDPAARLVLDREPGGKLLPVGQSQRYSVLVEKDGHFEPATDVHWPENFEDGYVRWEAPVLTAKREDYTQFLRAEVGGRTVLWHTTSYRPGEFSPEPQEEKPDLVRIFSQQGPRPGVPGTTVQQVRFPVGATFTDFKVEVRYTDGFTQFVTKKAVLSTPEPASGALVTADHGKLIGLRPGTTNVAAEFRGLTSKVPLTVVVTPDVEIDEITVEPGLLPLRPGETYEPRIFGYKDGKPAGDITALGNFTLKSSDPGVARIDGNSVIAASLGQSEVAVERKGLTSKPEKSAHVTVSNTIADDLRVEKLGNDGNFHETKTLEMFLGEGQQLGNTIRVMRGGLDVSRQATVVPESPGVVQFDPATRTLSTIGLGEVPLGVTMGDKITRVKVAVRPHAIEAGSKLVVEPGSLILAPGQADRVHASLEMPSGLRVATLAHLASADPSVADVDVAIGRVRALKPGRTEIKVSVDAEKTLEATVPVEVTSEEITALKVEPFKPDMVVDEHRPFQVFGQAPRSGLKEMFPQPDLKAAPRKADIVALIGGDDVQAKAEGSDTIDVAWRDKLKTEVPVNVATSVLASLEISPDGETSNPGQPPITYQVSALRGGKRDVLTTADGVQLSVSDPMVARRGLRHDRSRRPPRTNPGHRPLRRAKGRCHLERHPRRGRRAVRVVDDVDRIHGPIYDDHREVVHRDDREISDIPPAGPVVGLAFRPPVYQQGIQALPQTAKLLEQYQNGGFKDVSDDPNVKVTEPNGTVVTIKKVPGGWQVNPVSPGTTKMTATLGDQTAGMQIDILGDVGKGQLVPNPKDLDLWLGETRPITATMDPGGGQATVPVEATVKAPDGQGIVSVEGNRVTGRAVGEAAVTVSAGGQTATVNVRVTAAGTISFNPEAYDPQVGQTVTPAVMAEADGQKTAVQAQVESMDKNVLDADPAQPGQFVARSQGQTQLHATYRGKEAFAKVSVSGRRFQSVNSTHHNIDNDQFNMTIEVLAAGSEGELEYRVYAEGDPNPKENWVKNQPEGDSRKATFSSDPLSYGAGPRVPPCDRGPRQEHQERAEVPADVDRGRLR